MGPCISAHKRASIRFATGYFHVRHGDTMEKQAPPGQIQLMPPGSYDSLFCNRVLRTGPNQQFNCLSSMSRSRGLSCYTKSHTRAVTFDCQKGKRKIHAGISFLFSGSNGQTGILLLPTLLSIPTSRCHQLVVRSRKFASSGSSASQYTEMIIWSHFQGNTSLYWEFFRSSYADSTCIAAYVDCMIPSRAYVLVN